MNKLSIETYRYLYKSGGLGIEQIIQLVKDWAITEEEFKEITGYNYQGYLKNQKKKGDDYK